MKTLWKLQDAKSQFSKLVDKALAAGPQYVTRRGTEAVVVIATKQYEALTSKSPNFKEFLLICPKIYQHFEIERQKDYPRDVEL